MVKFSDLVYSLLHEFQGNGFDIADEVSEAAGEKHILLTVEGTGVSPETFNQGVETWHLAVTFVGSGSDKAQVYELLDEFCALTHRGCKIPVYTTDGELVLDTYAWLKPAGLVNTTLPYTWQFSQQFTLDVIEEAK